MITKKPAAGGTSVTVTFSVPAEEGPSSVVGEFNDWDPAANPLRKRGGRRSASIVLAGGRRYAYRYVGTDGRWFDDGEADDYVGNEFGERNCVVDLSGD